MIDRPDDAADGPEATTDASVAVGPAVAAVLGPGPGTMTAKSPNSVTTEMKLPPKPLDEVLSGCHEPAESRAMVASARAGSVARRTTLTRADAGAVSAVPFSSVTAIR